MLDKLDAAFAKVFPKNTGARQCFFAPGRILLAGDHIQRLGGNTLTFATPFGIYALCAPNGTANLGIYSLNEKGGSRLSLNAEFKDPGNWQRHPLTAVSALKGMGASLKGCDILIWGDVPSKRGFCSSAALEAAVSLALAHSSDFEIDKNNLYLSLLSAQRALLGGEEAPCDTGTILLAKENELLLFDNDDCRHRSVPWNADRHQFCAAVTPLETELRDDEIKERDSSMRKALRKAQTLYPKARNLSELNLIDLESLYGIITDLERKRAIHVVTEANRVREMMHALRNRDMFTLGKCMSQSHVSLKNDFNTSRPEIDLAADMTREIPGSIGAKIIGRGWGGSLVLLVDKKMMPEFSSQLIAGFQRETGLKIDFRECAPSRGAGKHPPEEIPAETQSETFVEAAE